MARLDSEPARFKRDLYKRKDSPLPTATCTKLVEIIEALSGPPPQASVFVDLVRLEIQRILPHEMAVFGVGARHENDSFVVHKLIHVDYPEQFLQHVLNPTRGGRRIKSPVVSAAAQANGYVEVDAIDAYRDQYPVWTEAAGAAGIHRFFAKCQPHYRSNKLTYHCFSNGPTLDDHCRRVAAILFPYLDATLLNMAEGIRQLPIELTRRELEILRYLSLGLKNRHIADELSISVYTVKNHIKNIFDKLEADNRTQAVNTALELDLLPGILPPDR